MKKLITLLLTVTLILNISTIDVSSAAKKPKNAWTANQPKVEASSAIVMEASTGVVLYEKNINKKHFPASITKVMTSLLCVENCSMNEIVTFSHNAVFGIEPGSSHISIDVGEKLTMEESLYGILLESANEVSVGVAEHISGSIDEFSDLMNRRAKELGCKSTHFVNPHGLHDDNHYTTAYDMALIAREAIKYENFRKITGTSSTYLQPTKYQPDLIPLNNNHDMIKYQSYDGCFGGKTGYTDQAKHTLVTYAKRDNMELICVVLEDSKQGKYDDTIKLLDYGFHTYSLYNIASNETSTQKTEYPFFTRFNPLFNVNSNLISINKAASIILPKKADFSDAIRKVTYTPASSNIVDSKTIGSISYYYSDQLVGSATIIYNNIDYPTLEKIATIPMRFSIKETFLQAKDESPALIKQATVPVLFKVVLTIFILLYIVYYLFIELPRKRRRKAFYQKQKRRKASRSYDLTHFK